MWIFQLAISTDQMELPFVKVPKVAILSFSLPMIIHHLPNKVIMKRYFSLLKHKRPTFES